MSRLTLITGLLISMGLLSNPLYGQVESGTAYKFGLYLDLFYGYDFNTPDGGQRLPYIYQYSRHNELNLNLGIISFSLDNERYRANMAFHAGTYVDDNYAAEVGTFKNIFDANIGFALDKKRKWWIDAGIFGNSWIGMQSTLAYDNAVVAHNLNSEYTPYYFSGLVGSFQPNNNWKISLILTNGWQRIKRVEGNSFISSGWQVTYTADNALTFNLGSFLGTDDPDSTRRVRHLYNFYTFVPLGSRWLIKGGLDLGFQQKAKGEQAWYNWYGIIAMINYSISPKWSASFRYEFYSDPDEVITNAIVPVDDFRASGVSANLDYQVSDFLKARTEIRWLNSPDEIFPKDQARVNDNLFLVFTLTAKMAKVFGSEQ